MSPARIRQRATVVAAAVVLALAGPGLPLVAAVPPPVIDPGAPPPDGPPGPAVPLRQVKDCAQTALRPGSDPHTESAGQRFMNLPALWSAAGRGAGVSVAVIDTGVAPSPRLPRLRGGGDYVVPGGDGLTDCDAHGSLVAAIIGGAPADTDAFAGVAPDADLIAIRKSSDHFGAADPGTDDTHSGWRTRSTATLARAIVHAVNLGARVINISVVSCIPVSEPVDQSGLGAALRYAAVDKDVVVVAAAGNTSNTDCVQNPQGDPANRADPRNWAGVKTISTPAWFSDYVLSVSATDDTDRTATSLDGADISLAGPWVGVAAPGVWLNGVNGRGEIVDATGDPPDAPLETISGTSFAAAYVSGLAALIRSKFPNLTAAQVIARITSTAHSPTGAVDNRMGHGIIDPLAAVRVAGPPSAAQPSAPPPQAAPAAHDPGLRGPLSVTGGVIVAAAVIILGAVALTQRRRRR